MHFLPDSEDPYGLVRRYLDALPSGSYLAFTHCTADAAPEEAGRLVEVYRQRGIPLTTRTRAEVERFLTVWSSSSRECRSSIAGGPR